jgi:FKBP-type peptidyl-prolyl cis-trans isomerase (trigger factor)
MKKKIITLILVLSIGGLVSGCSNDKKGQETELETELKTESNIETELEAITEKTVPEGEFNQQAASKAMFQTFMKLLEDIEPIDYIELSAYTGFDIALTRDYTITDEIVENQINNIMENSPVEVTERAVQDGDILNIDYVGKVDGVEFDRGSEQGRTLVIGSGSFIDGFETELIGAKLKEIRDIKVTFPADYQEATMQGVEAVFTVTINSISEKPTIEALALADPDVKNVDEYKAKIKKDLEETAKQYTYEEKVNGIWEKLFTETVVIKEYPTEYIDLFLDYYKAALTAEAKAASLSLEEYLLSYYGTTLEAYEEEMIFGINEMIQQALMIKEISQREGIIVSEKEFAESTKEYAIGNGQEDEEFIEMFGKEYLTFIYLNEKINDFLDEKSTASYTSPETEKQSEAQTETQTESESVAQ